jgi:DNA-binding MarR family transcriptional regulator
MPEQKMEEPFPINSQYELWLLLSQTRSAIYRARQENAGSYLHHNQATALCIIWIHQGQATPAMLSRSLFLERHSVSELISRMEENGLVKKTRDEKKKNVVRIAITEKGREVGHLITQHAFIESIINSLDQQQQEQLKTSLTILLKAAQKSLVTSADPLNSPDPK